MSFKNAYYHLNTHPSLPVNPTGTDDEIFGVLVLELNQVNITTRPVFILFTVDATGSMSEYVTHTTTKIQYAIQTLKSIVKYLSTQETDVYIQINTFNINVHQLIPYTKVSPQSLEAMLTLLQSIDADGTTNIEAALKSATASITEYATLNPTHSCVHIFMTDGEPTHGANTSRELIECVSNEYLSINIGFGTDHNAKLLCEISNLSNSEYHFIDNVENSSVVYGESLHKVLFPCLHNVNIYVENGLIYDWINNEWSTSIYENTLISEIKKYYHIKTSTPDYINIMVTAYRAEDHTNDLIYVEEQVDKLPELHDSAGNILHDMNIIKFAFRQCVLEVLYVATHTNHNLGNNVFAVIKQRIRDLFRIIRTYAQENNLYTDGIIIQLMNDLYLAYWNIGNTEGGELYIFGRHSSQGSQHAHTPGNQRLRNINIDTEFDIPPRPIMRRYNNYISPSYSSTDDIFGLSMDFLDINSNEQTIDMDGRQTDTEYSCYSSPGVRNTTSSIQLLED